MWKNLRVWGKLLVCILPLALVIIGSSFISYRAQSLMAESADRVEECEELRATFLNRAVDHFKWAQTLALYVALESSRDLNLVTDPSQCAFGKWYASQERKQAESIVPGLAQALRKIDAPHTALHRSALEISAAAKAGDADSARNILTRDSIPALDTVLAGLHEANVLLINEQEAATASAEQARKNANLFSLAALCLGVLISLVSILALRNAIMRPLNKLMSFASDCAGGNRDCTVDIERRDEFGKLAEALRSMVGHLNNQLAFSESVLNGLPVPTAIYTAENMLRFANRHMMNLLEAEGRPEDYYGRSSGDFLFRDPDRETASVRCLRSGQPEAKELPFTTYKGEARYALTQAAPLFDDHGRLTSVLSIWIDTTDAHKRQKEIEQAHTTMMEVANSSRQVAESLASASEELSAQIVQVNNGTAHQRDQLQETASAMTEMNASITEINGNAGNAAQLSQQAMEQAKAGEALVEKMLQSMKQLEARSLEIQTGMGDLQKHADGVGHVISVISDIADQTNLLALNAAIEAARAGESGRGFAVVADSVRELAEKTMQATKEVVSVIEAIQHGARSNASSVGHAVEAINATADLANQSGSALQAIVDFSRTVAEQVQAIAHAATEQAKASEMITQAINENSVIANETASAMDNAAQATADMAKQTSVLNGLIEELK